MALDHYVSQVHLKNFYSPELENLMYAIRKHDLVKFTPNSKSICTIEDGSTNAYLIEDRAIEEFLKSVEPRYNWAVDQITSRKINDECVYVVAGFAAYVLTCSPAAMRINSEIPRSAVEATARLLDENEQLGNHRKS